MKKITIGIVAHVDGGKTTLSEALLYTTGKIRKLGRVDHKDAYLDTFQMERDRGITIFSKQAVMEDWFSLIHRGMWTFQRKWRELYLFLIMQF